MPNNLDFADAPLPSQMTPGVMPATDTSAEELQSAAQHGHHGSQNHEHHGSHHHGHNGNHGGHNGGGHHGGGHHHPLS